MADKIIWYSPFERPYKSGYVLIETIESTYYVDYIKSETFDEWSDEIIRWAYIDDNNYARYQNALSDVEYYKEENEKLKKNVDEWFTKYLNLRLNFRELYDKYQRDAFVGKRSKFAVDDNCGGVNSDGDECLTTDDLCGVCKSDDARPVGEMSINELRDIFLKVMREAKERERVEEDDGK